MWAALHDEDPNNPGPRQTGKTILVCGMPLAQKIHE